MTSPTVELDDRPSDAELVARGPSSWLAHFYFDKLGNGSRPKLLFTLAAFDALFIVLMGYLASALVMGGKSWYRGLCLVWGWLSHWQRADFCIVFGAIRYLLCGA